MEKRVEEPDPLGVISSTRFVTDWASHVAISESALQEVCGRFTEMEASPPAWKKDLHFTDDTPRTANYVLVLDALNFCFWGDPKWRVEYGGRILDGYWALAACLLRALGEGRPILDAAHLGKITLEEVGEILRGEGEIPLLLERHAHLVEVGQVLSGHFGGQFANAVKECDGSAVELVRLVTRLFPSFNDVAHFEGKEVRFYKRAQILAADLYGAFDGRSFGAFRDLRHLTAFADYKLPQVLRRFGILRYHPDLAGKIAQKIPLSPGSPEEIEIRACTIRAVEKIKACLLSLDRRVESYQVDWRLWELGQDLPPEAEPHHRTRTIFY